MIIGWWKIPGAKHGAWKDTSKWVETEKTIVELQLFQFILSFDYIVLYLQLIHFVKQALSKNWFPLSKLQCMENLFKL